MWYEFFLYEWYNGDPLYRTFWLYSICEGQFAPPCFSSSSRFLWDLAGQEKTQTAQGITTNCSAARWKVRNLLNYFSKRKKWHVPSINQNT